MTKKSIQNTIKHSGKVLVIDDEPEIGWIFSKILKDNGYEVDSSQTGRDGLNKIRKFTPDLVFLDLRLPDKNGIHVLKEIKKINPDILIIMITAHETIQTAVEAMKLGAYDYIPKPVPNDRLKIIVDKALEFQNLSKELSYLKTSDSVLSGMIGQSEAMQKFFGLIRSASLHDVSVILRGESGTGKELAAHAIHALSRRKDMSFVPVDCATLPETLVESELFGYEKGAFTGADNIKTGRFELADKGTLFLDEIGNLTTHIQVKLLRVLQERRIDRLGGKNSIPINVRIISASNRNLDEAVEKGEFRDDLYHRLNVFEIILPPLRERGNDVALLATYFLDKFSRELDKKVKGFSDDVVGLFKEYSWPGNVRELENTVKSALILAKDRILPVHLPHQLNKEAETGIKNNNSVSLGQGKNITGTSLKEANKEALKNTEKYLIKKVLNETGWNKRKTAKTLGIDYKSLFNKIKKYAIKR